MGEINIWVTLILMKIRNFNKHFFMVYSDSFIKKILGADPIGIKRPMYLMGHKLLITIYWFKNPIKVTWWDIVCNNFQTAILNQILCWAKLRGFYAVP